MFCENLCQFHKNKTNCLLHLIGFILLIYSLWQHDINLIVLAIALFIIGHLIQFIQNKKINLKENKIKKKRK